MMNKAMNAEAMKYSNYTRLLNELRVESISRSELARRMGLTRAAISLQVDTLLSQGLVLEGESIASKSSGRSSIALTLNPHACYCIGIAIRRNFFGVGIFDFCGNELYSEHTLLAPPYDQSDSALAKMFDMIDHALLCAKPQGAFIGIGIGAPGPLDTISGAILAPPNLAAFQNMPIVRLLDARYHCPITLKNDASAHALCELFYGIRNLYDSFLVLEVTGGIGAGLVLNRQLYQSQLGNGTEIGHTTINIQGERCKCGNIGCAELYASLDRIVEYAYSLDSRFRDWKSIVTLADQGDSTARSVVEKEGFYLSTLIVNVSNLFDISAIILNGREVTYSPSLLLAYMRDGLMKRRLIRTGRTIDVLTSSIGNHPELLSAANLALDHFVSSASLLKSFADSTQFAK